MSHYDDEAQLEQLKRWWSENWKALFAGLALGLGGIFGWQGWQDHQRGLAEKAAQMYQDMKKAADAQQADQVQQLGQKLIQQHTASPYASQAALLLAQIEVGQGKLDAAAQHLAWVVEHSGDEGLEHVARLRQARVLWAQKRTEDALKLLEVKQAASFEPLYEELRGDIKLSQGDRAAAADAYRKALAGDEKLNNRDSLQRKLDDLAEARASS
jgi:predicted negative regulator of RcsB-dependent stress response